ncbi:MAG TPA: DUF4870 domain-containing protein [Gammaproteobacteria bacterium]|nr:DUF4870 domain-containing protein [Gammaproteobacteria bacterium]
MDNTDKTENETTTSELSADEKNMAMFCHLSAFLGILIPLANVIAPLIIWLIKKDEMPFVDRHGREALNFQISMTIYFFVSFILMFVFIGWLLAFGLAIFGLVVTIIAAVKASSGEEWQYPLRIPFVQ